MPALCAGSTGLARKLFEATLIFTRVSGVKIYEHSSPSATRKLFDKLGWWNEIVEKISSENQIKLERVYVRMPRHQEPKKDVAKLRKASGRRKQS